MGKCISIIDEVRFDVRDPDITHVYVYVRIEEDCPIQIMGWHHKAFPSRLSAVEIYQNHFADHLLWSIEAPNN